MKVSLLITLMLVAVPVADVLGQKDGGDQQGPVGIFQSGAEYDEFMRGAKELAYGEGGNPELQAMIPMLNDIALNKPMGWTNQRYGGAGGTLDLLSNSKVRDDLEMVDQQYEELKAMNDEVQRRAGEQLRTLDFGDRENLVQQIRKIRDQAESDLNSVLLPHQVERLRQLQSQSQLRNRSLVEVITSDPLKTELEISDSQSRELQEAEREIEQELEKEIAELRKKAHKKLLAKLKTAQREKVEDLFGEAFDFGDGGKKKRSGKKRK